MLLSNETKKSHITYDANRSFDQLGSHRIWYGYFIMNKYYVYAHVNKTDGSVFYIGKGSGVRANAIYNRNKFWRRIAKKHGYDIVYLCTDLTEDQAYKKEIELIKKYKSYGQCYANFTNGGDGVRVDKRWWNDKISKSLKGRITPKGVDNPSYKPCGTMDELFNLYVTQRKSTIEISKIYNVSTTTIWERLRQYNIKPRIVGSHGVKIICINDGMEFNSILSAAKYYKVHRENIRKVLKGKYKHTNNLQFKYI